MGQGNKGMDMRRGVEGTPRTGLHRLGALTGQAANGHTNGQFTVKGGRVLEGPWLCCPSPCLPAGRASKREGSGRVQTSFFRPSDQFGGGELVVQKLKFPEMYFFVD